MGGLGSGRPSWRGVLEHCYRLDVNRFHRKGYIGCHTWTSWVWSNDEGERLASISISFHPDWLELSYTVNPREENERQLCYRVHITWTPCNYGGERPWFICPNTRCGRRVGKLYLWGGYFICRHCTGAAYESQREDRSGRLMERARKIRMRLGGGPNLMEPFPWKPKRMRWRTYWRLRDEYYWANNASVVLMAQRFGISLDD